MIALFLLGMLLIVSANFGVVTMSNKSSFAPPVESRVLGSVTTPSGASPLAGHPDCVPSAMSGDAWESAANHVIATRKKPSPNRNTWQQIGLFLDAQHLETLGLRRVDRNHS